MAELLYKVKVVRITIQNGVLAQLLSCQFYITIYYISTFKESRIPITKPNKIYSTTTLRLVLFKLKTNNTCLLYRGIIHRTQCKIDLDVQNTALWQTKATCTLQMKHTHMTRLLLQIYHYPNTFWP